MPAIFEYSRFSTSGVTAVPRALTVKPEVVLVEKSCFFSISTLKLTFASFRPRGYGFLISISNRKSMSFRLMPLMSKSLMLTSGSLMPLILEKSNACVSVDAHEKKLTTNSAIKNLIFMLPPLIIQPVKITIHEIIPGPR